LTLSGTARAHRLEGEYAVLPNHRIKITCWFETGNAPKVARVTVLRGNGDSVFPGAIEMKEGVLEFPYDKAEALRVEISAGQGHHKVLEIPAEELKHVGSVGGDAPPRATTGDTGASGPDVRGVLAGVGLLLGLGAFVLSLVNARRVRQLRDQLRRLERSQQTAERFTPDPESGVQRYPSGRGS
jgi:hypothetical protein